LSVTGDERAAGGGGDQTAWSTDQGAGPFDRVYSERSRRVAAWAREEQPAKLTDRELEVLRLVAKGWTNARIALELDVTERTVRFHLESLFARLEVDNRVEAVVKVIRGEYHKLREV